MAQNVYLSTQKNRLSELLSIAHLTKRYGRRLAVDDLCLQIPTGRTYGLLGPNGSGKTTILGMILGVLYPSSGSYLWFEGNFDTNPNTRIGALLETPNYYPYLSGWQNLKIQAIIKGAGNGQIENALRRVMLWDRRSSAFSSYSLGMKQRLSIAGAMLNDPEVLVLDEPTNGLDPAGIAEVRTLILELGKEGRSIIIASHLLDEVEKICTDVCIIKQGKLLSNGPIMAADGHKVMALRASDMGLLESLMNKFPMATEVHRVGEDLRVTLPASLDPALLNVYLFDNGLVLSMMSHSQKSLESHFLSLTQ